MSRYIDADKIEEVIRDDVPFGYFMASGYGVAMINRLEIAKILNDKIPTADVKEVKHGQWTKDRNFNDDLVRCSACHILSDRQPNYCPYCGARMDGGVMKNDKL